MFVPGDVIVSKRKIRAWESWYERGTSGRVVEPGLIGVLIGMIPVSARRYRLIVLLNARIEFFNHFVDNIETNWQLVNVKEDGLTEVGLKDDLSVGRQNPPDTAEVAD